MKKKTELKEENGLGVMRLLKAVSTMDAFQSFDQE